MGITTTSQSKKALEAERFPVKADHLLVLTLRLGEMLLNHFTTDKLTFVGWALLHACLCGSVGGGEKSMVVFGHQKKRERKSGWPGFCKSTDEVLLMSLQAFHTPEMTY